MSPHFCGRSQFFTCGCYYIYPAHTNTYDLRLELLSYGPEVEVLAPAALRQWLQQQHAEAAELVS